MYYIKESYVICNKTQEFTYRLDLFYTKELIIHVKKLHFYLKLRKGLRKLIPVTIYKQWVMGEVDSILVVGFNFTSKFAIKPNPLMADLY